MLRLTRVRRRHWLDTESVLVCGVGDQQRFAMPISMVARLEEFPRRRLNIRIARNWSKYGASCR
ncbi:MAG: hypothetical protein U0992_07740 [Planctomycetaceae bacterium]